MSDQPVPSQTDEKPPPDSPTDLEAPDLKQSVRRALKEFKADRGSLVSAGIAFYWFLAVFPAVLAAVGILGLVHAGPGVVSDINKAINTALPGDAAKVLTDAVWKASTGSKGGSFLAAIVGVALSLWSASAGMVALQTGTNIAYDVPEDRTFVSKRGVAFMLVGVTVVLGGIATAAIVFGQPIGQGLKGHLPFGGSAFVVLWTVLRWVIGLGALVVLFACFYSLAPKRETPRWTWVSPGGVVATVVWLLASLAFSLYVSSIGSYAKTYGSITGVVVLLLWLYLSALAVMIGAELNAELNAELERQADRRRRREGDGQPAPRPGATAPPPPQPRQATQDRQATQPRQAPPPPQAPTPVGSENGHHEAPAATERSEADAWFARMRELRDDDH